MFENYKAIEFPLESVFLDIDYMDTYNTFTVDTARFPLNSTDGEEGNEYKWLPSQRLIPILDVGIGLEKGDMQVRIDALNMKIAIATLDEHIYIGRVWPGYTLFPDF